MRSPVVLPPVVLLVVLAAAGLAACAQSPLVQQATVDARFDPVRADTMVAVNFAPGSSGLDAGQVNELRTMVAAGRRAQRDEFVVVSDGSGGPVQRLRAQRVSQSLSEAGARWVGTSVEPAMAMGPNAVVIVRSEYLLGQNCPTYSPATIANPNEALMPGYGCADAYNMGQMLARPRDAAVGRPLGPADATVNAAAIARYREGKVKALDTSGIVGGVSSGGGGIGGGAAPGATN
jgi:type IV pilus biogenesis protein CpaD/CtpE